VPHGFLVSRASGGRPLSGRACWATRTSARTARRRRCRDAAHQYGVQQHTQAHVHAELRQQHEGQDAQHREHRRQQHAGAGDDAAGHGQGHDDRARGVDSTVVAHSTIAAAPSADGTGGLACRSSSSAMAVDRTLKVGRSSAQRPPSREKTTIAVTRPPGAAPRAGPRRGPTRPSPAGSNPPTSPWSDRARRPWPGPRRSVRAGTRRSSGGGRRGGREERTDGR
jgi:hypothetical protein